MNDEPITYAEKEIAKHQLKVQETAIKAQLLMVEIRLTPYSSKETWLLYDTLKEILENVIRAQKLTEQMLVKKAFWWDRLKLKIYYWAVIDRFKKETLEGG